MSESHISDDDREKAEHVLDRYEENPEDFEDLSDEFLPPAVQKLLSEWLRDECTQDEFIRRTMELSSDETATMVLALQDHYERKLNFIREAAQPDIPA